MISDAQLDRLKADNPCDEYAARFVRLRRGRQRQVGPCPICSRNSQSRTDQRFETDAAGWVCAVCDDGGDVIKLVSKIEGISFLEAIDRLGGIKEIDPAVMARRAAELAALKAEREKTAEEFRDRERNSLFAIWQAAAPAEGSDVEHYLAGRGVALPPGARLRCVGQMAYFGGKMTGDDGREYKRILHRGPAMIAAIQGADGKFRGLHFTYLDPAQPKGKALVADPETGEVLPSKKVRGSKDGGRVALVRPGVTERLVIGEGIETVLTAWHAGDDGRTAYWSALDLGNLGGAALETVLHPTLKDAAGRRRRVPGPRPNLDRPGIVVPDSVREIVLLGDGDSDRVTTENALRRAAARWARPGRVVRVAWAPDGKDFNDLALDQATAILAAAVPFDAPAAAVEPAPAAENVVEVDFKGKKKTGKKAEKKDAGATVAAIEPRRFGFDIDDMNSRFALVVLGGKSVIFWDQPEAAIEHRKRFISLDAFNAYFANRFTEYRDAQGNIRSSTWGLRFLRHKDRRTYDGIEFYPDPDNKPGLKSHLNLWEGFTVVPASVADPKRFSVFRDHVFTNICGGNEAHFLWVWAFFAHMLQRPRERIGVALVLRGRQGAGKTKLGEVIGALIAAHYFMVDDPRYVTGNFNAHMATCLLLQADEAVWAGDKAAEGRLKGLITAPMQQIEAKGVDPIRLPNYVRLLLTSNEDWVVPAGKDERRMGVLDVSDRCAQNHEYFREMDAQLADGGLAHLLADLLAFDLSKVNLRQVIRTEALLEQKVRTLDSIDSWLFACINQGILPRHAAEWPDYVPGQALYDDYINASERQGIKRKQDPITFGLRMFKLMPGLVRVRRTVNVADSHGQQMQRRAWCYKLPPLVEVRAAWEYQFGQKIEWETPVENDEREPVDFVL